MLRGSSTWRLLAALEAPFFFARFINQSSANKSTSLIPLRDALLRQELCAELRDKEFCHKAFGEELYSSKAAGVAGRDSSVSS